MTKNEVLDSVLGARRTLAIALCVAVVAVLLPAALESQQSGAVGPPAGCRLTTALEPSFSANSSRIAFSAVNGQNGVRQIFVSNLDGKARAEISGNATNNRQPAFSPLAADNRVAWSGQLAAPFNPTNRIIVALATGSDPDPEFSVSVPVNEARHPRWSPDGTRIAWSGGLDIWVTDPDGENRVQVTEAGIPGEPTFNQRPVFNAAGTKIAWSGLSGGVRHIYVANVDGSGRQAISSVGGALTGNNHPDFDDGNRIVWSGNNGSEQLIYVANENGTARVEISSVGAGTDPTANTSPRFSPDGSQVVWVGVRPFTGSIDFVLTSVFVANANGTNRTDLTNNSGFKGSSPLWSPDGNKIAWSGQGSNGVQIWVSINKGAPKEISIVDDLGLCPPPPTTSTTPPPPTTLGPGQKPPTTTTSLPGGKPACPTGPTPFTDVRANSFAAADIRCIYGLGITTGTSPTKYSPNNFVTREQMASFLARLWRTAGGSCPTTATPFTDVAANSFAVNDVKCIYWLGFTTGTSPTQYSPKDFVTREQMASFLARVWRGAGNSCPTAVAPFTDVSPTSFARTDINCIYGLGITTGTSPTRYSPGDSVTREQMAAFLGRLYRSL